MGFDARTRRFNRRSLVLRAGAMLGVVGLATAALVAQSDIAHARNGQEVTRTSEVSAQAITTSTTVAAPTTTTTIAPTPTSLAVGQIGTYTTTTSDVTVVDTTRSSPDRGDAPGSSQRSLRTLVIAPVVAAGTPLPVIVFAHGYDSEPEDYAVLLQTWASAGYLVLAPESPGSARDLPGTPVRSDIGGQALDLSFEITQAVAGTFGPVDATRISVAGHSDGGSAVATLALNGAYHDPRIANYLVLSGAIPDGVDGTWGTAAESGRLLVVVGDQDEYGNLPASTAVYDTATMAKTLAIAPGGDHVDTYLAASTLAEDVRAETVAFLAGGTFTGSLEISSTPAA